jgi:hypothetical protein
LFQDTQFAILLAEGELSVANWRRLRLNQIHNQAQDSVPGETRERHSDFSFVPESLPVDSIWAAVHTSGEHVQARFACRRFDLGFLHERGIRNIVVELLNTNDIIHRRFMVGITGDAR